MAGVQIDGEYQLISMIRELSEKRREYESVQEALNAVHGTGYGVITPQKRRDPTRSTRPYKNREIATVSKIKSQQSVCSSNPGRYRKPRSHRSSAAKQQAKRPDCLYRRKTQKGEKWHLGYQYFRKNPSAKLVEDGIRTKTCHDRRRKPG